MYSASFCPTVKCEHCQYPADKVCYHHQCKQYPFMCTNNNLCLNSIKLHNHSHQHSTISLNDFRNTVKSINLKFSQTHLQIIKHWERKVKSKISCLIKTHQQILTQKYVPKFPMSIQKIIQKIQKPSNYPDLFGFQIHRVLKTDFNQQDQNYQTNKLFQSMFNEFTKNIDRIIEAFEIKYQLKLKELGAKILQQIKNQQHQQEQSLIFNKIQPCMVFSRKQQQQFEYVQLQQKQQQKHITQQPVSKNNIISQSITASLNQAQAYFNKQQYNTAIKILKQVKQQDFMIYFKLGQYIFHKATGFQDYDQSIQYYTKSFSLSKSSQPLNGIGTVLTYKYQDTKEQKYLTQAIQYFEQALKYSKKSYYFYNRGNCYYKLQMFQQAIDSYTQAIASENDKIQKAGSFYSRGQCYLQLKQLKQAKKDHLKAYQLDPNTEQYFQLYKSYTKSKIN